MSCGETQLGGRAIGMEGPRGQEGNEGVSVGETDF